MLKLSFSVCQKKSCGSIVVSETTGTINTLTNPNGWGSPNATIASVSSALIKISLPGSTTSIDIDVSPLFPTVDESLEFEITAVDLGMVDNITDGIYQIVYEVVANGITYSEMRNVFLYCNTQCCVSKLIAKIPEKACSCKDTAVEDAVTSYMLMKSLEYAAICGKSDKFTNTLAVLNNICKNNTCDSSGTVSNCTSCSGTN